MSLIRVEHPNGVITYESPLLRSAGVIHGFSTRIGGHSEAPYDTLSLGQGRDAGMTGANFHALQHALGADGMLPAWVNQVHGRGIELLEADEWGLKGNATEYGETLEAELRDQFSGQTPADGLITNTPNLLLAIRIADCVPLLLASAGGPVRAVAAIHAGWRGIVGGIVGRAVRALGELGVSPAHLVAAIGPCISVDHFEVGEEVAAAFDAANLAHTIRRDPKTYGPKPHIDLQAAVAHQLHSAAVTQIDTHSLCTFRDSPDFFSHRRDHGTTGRMAALIAIPTRA